MKQNGTFLYNQMNLSLQVDDPKVSAIAVEEQLIRVTTAEKLYGGDVRKTVDFYNKFIGKRLKGNALVQNMSQVCSSVSFPQFHMHEGRIKDRYAKHQSLKRPGFLVTLSRS